jgi:deoxyribonuclease V
MKAQRLLASRIILKSAIEPCSERIVAAFDVAYRRTGPAEYGYGVALVYDSVRSDVLDCTVAVRRIRIPYIPGLLAFRELAVLAPLGVRVKRRWRPDVILVDGHGISHPRRIGIASHLGLVLGIPSIGVAKKKLTGKLHDEYVVDDNGNPTARIVRTTGGSVIYVSPGHLMDLDSAYRIVMKYLKNHRLPEPLHLADAATKAAKRLIKPSDELVYKKCAGLFAW